MKREPSFYWVMKDNKWIIAEYAKSDFKGVGSREWLYWWYLTYDNGVYQDSAFQQIDETPITRK